MGWWNLLLGRVYGVCVMKLNAFRTVVSRSFLVPVTFLLVGVVGLSVAGCEDEQKTLEWRTALERIDRTDTQLFSFGYTSAPPEGSMFYISVLDPGDVAGLTEQAGGACSLFDNSVEKPSNPDFWYLKITLSSTTVGSYKIVSDIDLKASSQASVQLIHIQDWKRKAAALYAVGGTVKLEGAPQNFEDWDAGMNLRAIVDAQFPDAQVRQVECHSEGSTDGSVILRECICEDLDGNQSTCVPKDGQSDCCSAASGELFNYHLEVAANQCKFMCAANDINLFEEYCPAYK